MRSLCHLDARRETQTEDAMSPVWSESIDDRHMERTETRERVDEFFAFEQGNDPLPPDCPVLGSFSSRHGGVLPLGYQRKKHVSPSDMAVGQNLRYPFGDDASYHSL